MRVRIVVAIGVLAAVLIGVTSAGAAVGGRHATQKGEHPYKLDLSSMSKIRSYLRSISVDPSTVVIQRGHRNYAGGQCPGRAWNCTRATRVVQIAMSGGQNSFTCTPSTGGFADLTGPTCLVVQASPGGNNQAQCIERNTDPTTTQACIVRQTGDMNTAMVQQDLDQSAGTTQDARQIADVRQLATSKNDSDIHQSINQNESTAASQAQDGHQLAQVAQFVSGSENFSHVHQTQSQTETGSAVTQTQNTAPAPVVTVNSTPYNFACAVQKPANPNQCANVCQTSVASGTTIVAATCGDDQPTAPVDNESHLHQFVAETESTSNPAVTNQTQGDQTNGQNGEIHQENPVGSGLNHNHSVQSLGQREVAPGIETGTHQHQLTDPGCCGASQFGGSDALEDINQSTDMSATGNLADQESTLFGQSHQVSTVPEAPTNAATTTPPSNNNCSIDQHGRTNSGGDHFSVSGHDPITCASLTLTTECTNVVEGSAPSCQPVEQCIQCDLPAVVPTALLPTYGQNITMPSFAEPSSYVPFGG